jgi:MFS family permease
MIQDDSKRNHLAIKYLRWGIVVLLMLGMVNSYFDRMNMSFAATSISHEFGQWIQMFKYRFEGTPATLPLAVDLDANHAITSTGAGFVPFLNQSDSLWRALPVNQLAGDSLSIQSVVLDRDRVALSGLNSATDSGKILIFKYESPKSDAFPDGKWNFEATVVPEQNSSRPLVLAFADDVLLVGAPGELGAVFVYQRAETEWPLVARLLPPGETPPEWGRSVAVNQNFAFVGAAGQVLVFQKQAGQWIFFQELTAEIASNYFGAALALDAEYALVRAGEQVVSVFQLKSGRWELQSRLTPESPENGATFGSAVDLDGNYAIVGTHTAPNGAAYIFHREGRRWMRQARLVPDSTAGMNRFGRSVAINPKYALVAAETSHPVALIFRHQPIDPTRMGFILAMFFWAYGIMQVPAGRLVDKFGIRKLYTATFLVWGLVATAFGLVTSVWMFIALRGALGVLESVSAPASMAFIVRYFDDKERGLATGIYLAGTKLGPAIGGILAAWLIGSYGWRMLFILCGLVPLGWLFPWEYYYRKLEKRLGDHADVSGKNSGRPIPAKKLIPLKKLFTRQKTWGIFWGSAAYSYVLVLYLSWLPTYFREQLHFSLTEMGAFSGIAFGGVAIMVPLAGAAADFLIRRGWDSSKVRKGFVIAGFLMGSLIIPVPFIRQPQHAVTVLLIAIVSMGLATANTWAIMQAIAPENTTGTLAGVQNLGGSVGSAIAPLLTGFMVSTSGTFNSAFVLAGVIMLSGILNYVFLIGKIERMNFPEAGIAIIEPSGKN